MQLIPFIADQLSRWEDTTSSDSRATIQSVWMLPPEKPDWWPQASAWRTRSPSRASDAETCQTATWIIRTHFSRFAGSILSRHPPSGGRGYTPWRGSGPNCCSFESWWSSSSWPSRTIAEPICYGTCWSAPTSPSCSSGGHCTLIRTSGLLARQTMCVPQLAPDPVTRSPMWCLGTCSPVSSNRLRLKWNKLIWLNILRMPRPMASSQVSWHQQGQCPF